MFRKPEPVAAVASFQLLNVLSLQYSHSEPAVLQILRNNTISDVPVAAALPVATQVMPLTTSV